MIISGLVVMPCNKCNYDTTWRAINFDRSIPGKVKVQYSCLETHCNETKTITMDDKPLRF